MVTPEIEDSGGGGESPGEEGDGEDEPPSPSLVILLLPFEGNTETSPWDETRKTFMQELGKLPITLIQAIVTAIVIAILLRLLE